jgi:hypothetical protein
MVLYCVLFPTPHVVCVANQHNCIGNCLRASVKPKFVLAGTSVMRGSSTSLLILAPVTITALMTCSCVIE